MPSLDYDQAKNILEAAIREAEQSFHENTPPTEDSESISYLDSIFNSNTQAYREALLGCILASALDSDFDIRKPYVNLGPDAFNGRTLDEKVVNPFLQNHSIPCSRGPYLSVFRRSVSFDSETRGGVRDKSGYDAFLNIIGRVENFKTRVEHAEMLHILIYRFVLLRESSNVPLSRIHRLSIEQYSRILSGLLEVPSGGRFPVILAASVFEALRQCFHLDWDIEVQGIKRPVTNSKSRKI